KRLFRESLALNHELGDKVGISAGVLGVAKVAAIEGQAARAARLLGAAAALREASGVTLLPGEAADHERQIDALRASPGFTEAWAEGRALSLEEVVEHALGD